MTKKYFDNFLLFQRAVATLKKEDTPSELVRFADETLEYLKTREKLWKKQTHSSRNRVVDFSPENFMLLVNLREIDSTKPFTNSTLAFESNSDFCFSSTN